jgi:hypothetical protein
MADKSGISVANEIVTPILTSSPVVKSALGVTITTYLAFVAPILAAFDFSKLNNHGTVSLHKRD